ncbi:hypothetical protein ACFB49_30500 [Sphingomonas sp. DBB INV C78]|uniref:hypothetical protein n=1 Tax=Sphingomonas sp. DBB INV C78 TaxID=3349434 RepID=UPI0036D2F575
MSRKRLILAAKNRVGRWYDHQGEPTTDRRALLAAVDTFFAELQTRDDQIECRTVLLGDAGAPRFAASTPRCRIIACQQGLAVAALGPDWAHGWRRVIADDHAEFILSWFAHYARQYVHRGEFARALMMAWERNAVTLHMFGSAGTMRRYGSEFAPTGNACTALAVAATEAAIEWGACPASVPVSRSPWLGRNTLDPGIHQGIFHFLRGQELRRSGFEVEALVAFDCVIHALQAMPWPSARATGSASRPDLFRELRLRPPSIATAEQIYFIRKHFGAHAGGWRWWDVGDEYEDDFLDKASHLVWRMLRRAADLEPEIRVLEPDPPRWSDWLLENFVQIWNIVWFR